MSFGFRGVRGCGRRGGGSEEWMKLEVACATNITRGLASRSDAAIQIRTAIQQFRTTIEDEECDEEGDIVKLHYHWYTFVLIGTSLY